MRPVAPVSTGVGISASKRGGSLRCRPQAVEWRNLLQAVHRGQVSRALDDAGCAAPVGADAGRLDRRDRGSGEGIDVASGCEIAGECVAVPLRQVGVVLADIAL